MLGRNSVGRLYYIDHLRVVVNLLIVLNHALWNRYWDPFVSGDSEVVLEIVRDFSMHLAPLRVPFFFLIAGYFSLLVVQKRGGGGICEVADKAGRSATIGCCPELFLCGGIL